ncbi:hypothetical protein FQZ97_852520 [compost metagenome]
MPMPKCRARSPALSRTAAQSPAPTSGSEAVGDGVFTPRGFTAASTASAAMRR